LSRAALLRCNQADAVRPRFLLELMMSTRLLKTVTLLVFSALSAAALADDPPARVGRVALTQGQVSISGDLGEPADFAQVNFPVTSGNTITTAPGARTELRIGSTSIRLDRGSALEVSELDDDNLRLRLHYGSASVRIVNPEVVSGFELSTPEAIVHLQQPGRLRVDAERVPDTSMVEVFDGVARIEGGGSELTIRAGRRAELREDDVRTAQAIPDAFDDWSFQRDQYEDRSRSTRYVVTEMTGYEDLDRYGSWQTDVEYGTLWIPSVGPDWVPYRDGSWVWVEPWGWTWVDNAPWGYAPFHYGRWVFVNHRWCWAPGRRDYRPVWAPALVGWVGGAGWSVTVRGHQHLPAQGWYPLTPHDRYVPWYHASPDYVRWWNRGVRHDHDHDHDRRHEGLTVVPHEAFWHHGRVEVARAPKLAPPPLALRGAPAAPPPAFDGPRHHGDDARFGHRQPVPVLTAPPVMVAKPAAPAPVSVQSPRPGQVMAVPQPHSAVTIATPAPANEQAHPNHRQHRDWRDEAGDARRSRPEPLSTEMPMRRSEAAPAPGTLIASPPMQRGPVAGTVIASPPMQRSPAPGAAVRMAPPATEIAPPPRAHRGGEVEQRWPEPARFAPRAMAQPSVPAQPPAPPVPARPMAPPVAVAPAAPPMARPMAPPAAHAEERHVRTDGKYRQQER
jgi:hypothetical protein